MLIEAFDRFAVRARERLGDDCPAFLPGADAAALSALEEALGVPLPPELQVLLAHSAGQADGVAGPLNFARFLRPEEIGAMHTMLDEAVDGWDAEQPSCYSADVWSPGWIPFMAFQGDAYCIDTAPGTAGRFGQVFMRPNVPDLEDPLSATLEGFLLEAAAATETAEVTDGTFRIPGLF